MKSSSTYSPNGISHCPKARISEGANVFYYYWIDAISSDIGTPTNRTTVQIPPGNYDVHELNSYFETVMFQNNHYFIYSPSQSNVFLMKIIYNNANNCIEIQTFSTASVSNQIQYAIPRVAAWSRPNNNVVPVYYIPATGFQNIIGFSSGYYPNTSAYQTNTSYGALSNIPHTIYPSYSITYYKPSNMRFANQGGVSSSDMTQRVKYETISRNGLAYSNAFGSQVGNAMSYGVNDQVYTIKDKIGYPVKKTPVIDKYTGNMKCLANGRLVGYCASTPSG
jgi:hypothetical protein